MSGWIKLHKKIQEWEWYKDGPCFKLFMHCLLSAQYSPSRYQGHEIPGGSFVAGRIELSAQTGLSEQQVRTALHKLEKTGELTIKKTNKFSIISVLKWTDYQAINQTITNNQPTSNQQVTTSKERKNIRKKDINNILDRPADVSQSVWDDFVNHRKGVKAPLTSTALSGIAREASKAGITLETALREVCARGWRGFKAEWVMKEKTNDGKLTTHERLKLAGDEAINELFSDLDRKEQTFAIAGPVDAEL